MSVRNKKSTATDKENILKRLASRYEGNITTIIITIIVIISSVEIADIQDRVCWVLISM